ncbi:efflux transporter outer membrane subunit [bacterium AH-315-G11]|nr:efflux transporter outer membrane subunit [bacterium AH-315-G11]
MIKYIIRILALLLIGQVLIACAVGPNFKSPVAPKVTSYSNQFGEQLIASDTEQPQLLESDTIPADWWQLFKSKKLDFLVKRGLLASPTLLAAEARLNASREMLRANTGSILFPTVDANIGSTRQKVSGATFGGKSILFSLQNASLDVSYNLDPAGGGRRFLEYGYAQVEYEVFQLHAARTTLVVNIVIAAINEASLREQIIALKEIIDAQQQQLNLSEKKFDIGVIAKKEVLSQRASLAQVRTQLPTLQQSLIQTRHQLAMLTGGLPGKAQLPEFRLSDLTLPYQIPLTLPSQLIRQRPDVRASEALLHQASAQIGVATANLYPSFTLTGSYGTEATRIADLFSAGTAVWGLGAGLLQPVFHGGELRAKKRAAVASYQQAAAEYRQNVLIAFQDVADALLALKMDAEKLKLEQQAEALAMETYELVGKQHQQGAVSYLDLLNAQSQYQQARMGQVQARATLYSDTAALMYALGGGWWNNKTNVDTNKVEKTVDKAVMESSL